MEKRKLFQKFSKIFKMKNISNSEAARLISLVIDFLKTQKITQQEIESRLNYTSLSKAKNSDRYPQIVIEKKTRIELLKELLEEFSLFYDEAYDQIGVIDEKKINSSLSDVSYYIMHYYAFSRNLVGKALVQIINKRKVIIDYNNDAEHWEGTFNVIENYSFIEAQKLGYTTPVKKLICLFSGTMKYGRPILLGTYSTIKRDGYPAAGRVVFERKPDFDSAKAALEIPSDNHIIGYLKNDVIISRTITPNSLKDLLPMDISSVLRHIVGKYILFYPDLKKRVVQTQLWIKENFQIEILIHENTSLMGKLFMKDINTIQCKFNITKDLNIDDFSLLTINIDIRKKSSQGILSAVGNSTILHGKISSFSCYLAPVGNTETIDASSLPIKLILCDTVE